MDPNFFVDFRILFKISDAKEAGTGQELVAERRAK